MIRLLCVGSLKADWAREACAEYAKRAGRWSKIEIVEVPDSGTITESRALLTARGKEPLVACDRRGDDWDTEHLAGVLGRHGRISFAIGGPDGHSAELLDAADHQWRFGRVTLPHELARLVLLEQIYRALSIRGGHPYHR
jgi:23S rRNA (pseudouridine1915-N3)-methyltransferase